MSEPTYIAQHEVSPDDTLSGIALKYYGSAIKDMWMIIYEANKDVIGPNPNILKPGIVLKIPPKDFKAAQSAPAQPTQAAAKEDPAYKRHAGDEGIEQV